MVPFAIFTGPKQFWNSLPQSLLFHNNLHNFMKKFDYLSPSHLFNFLSSLFNCLACTMDCVVAVILVNSRNFRHFLPNIIVMYLI